MNLASEHLLSLAKPWRMHDHETMLIDTGGNGEPFLLLHALGPTWQMWCAVIDKLAPFYRVIAYDLRGHGHAIRVTPPFLFELYMADALAVMDGLNISKAHVAGISIGGVTGQYLAVHHAERLLSMSLVCTTTSETQSAAFLQRASDAERDGLDAQVELTMSRWFSPDAVTSNREAVQYAREEMWNMGTANWAGVNRALAAIDITRKLHEVRVSTQVIAGECDPSTPPEMMRKIADQIPHSKFYIVPKGNHMLTLEKPEELATILKQA
jgi:3-oxoadipate enol-lactonase